MATNVKGSSLESTASLATDATIITSPDAVVSFSENTVERTATTIGLSWSTGEGRRLSYSDGGSVILDYRINQAV